MKKSHRKGITLENEYGIDKANDIKKKYSKAAIARFYTEHEYVCIGCKLNFKSEKQLFTSNKYCSKECQLQHSNLKIVQCNQCGLEIKKRIYETKKYYFCSRPCYHQWQKNNITPPQNELRRINSNSKHAIEKRRITFIKNGLWHDHTIFVEGMNKKEYGKVVRILTKRKFEELLKTWDGHDYYTKEYIRDNFKLHWSHGDYPSIDHKISITEGMRLGMTPVELSDISNLVFTKKRVNSMKRAMTESKFWEKIKTLNV